MRSQSVSVLIVESVRVLRKCQQASMPSLCGMLVEKDDTPRVTREALSGSCSSC